MEKGIQLITIWEDDWRYHPDIVKSMISYKLGVSTEPRVYARNTLLKRPSAMEASRFMNQYHIQGYASGSVRIGLAFDNKMVACAIFRKRNDDTLELVRYATSCQVIGGLGKILSHINDSQQGFHHIITFSDHMVSDGSMYRKLGFHQDGELRPDYMYIVDGCRAHKFGYRLRRFRDDPHLQYKDGLSESQLALLNHIDKVYDAGKTRWVLDISAEG
jgi:hypothetical protein